MSVQSSAPGLLRQFWWRLQPVHRAAFVCGGFDDLDRSIPGDIRSFVEDSYPQNHTYTAAGACLRPSRKLASRVAQLSRFYPNPCGSFLDLSCSKGFFVFHAAMQPGCERVLGIDQDQRSLEVCRALNSRFDRRANVNFADLTLTELATRIDEFGGPFQVALLVNTYQYLVFGSSVAPPVSHDHREIFRLLRQVCSGRLIFHNRLTFSDLQSDPQERARQRGCNCVYEPEVIQAAAAEYFDVRRIDRWSRRSILLLDAR